MELYADDYCLIEGVTPINQDSFESLFVLYQPLIGNEACSLYLTLCAIGNENEAMKHLDLCNILDMSLEKVEKARVRLEQHGLLQTYLKKGKRNQYIYRIISILNPSDFLNHYALGLQYNERFGNQKYQMMKARYEARTFDKSEYDNISEHLDRKALLNLSVDQLEEMIKSNKQESRLPVGFDYGRFLKGLSNTVFPKSLRSDENMKIIGQLALTYGISEERMKVLVSRSINIETIYFDKETLIRKVRAEKPNFELEQITGYDLPPVLFLVEKQRGAPVSNTDKRLLESLVNDYGLATPVVNLLVEYVLEQNNKILNTDYVKKIAATWVMHEVKTAEDARQVIAMMSRSNKEREMRSATIEKSNTIPKKKIIKNESEEDLRELEDMIQKLGERYEKSSI
jgi:Replication initiation/membrane attachment protein